jgi:hypothetical protein
VIHGDLKPTNLMLDFDGSSSAERHIWTWGSRSARAILTIGSIDKGRAALVRAGAARRDDRLRDSPGSATTVRPIFSPGASHHLLSGREPYSARARGLGEQEHACRTRPPSTPTRSKVRSASRAGRGSVRYAGDARQRRAERTRPASVRPSAGHGNGSMDHLHRRGASADTEPGLAVLPTRGAVEEASVTATAVGLSDFGRAFGAQRRARRSRSRRGTCPARLQGQKPFFWGPVSASRLANGSRAGARRASWSCSGAPPQVRRRSTAWSARQFAFSPGGRPHGGKTLLAAGDRGRRRGKPRVAARRSFAFAPGEKVPLGPTGKRFFRFSGVRYQTILKILERIGRIAPSCSGSRPAPRFGTYLRGAGCCTEALPNWGAAWRRAEQSP